MDTAVALLDHEYAHEARHRSAEFDDDADEDSDTESTASVEESGESIEDDEDSEVEENNTKETSNEDSGLVDQVGSSYERAITAITDELSEWVPATDTDAQLHSNTLHPFLLDPRVKTWVFQRLFDCYPFHKGRFRRFPEPWALHAIKLHDPSLLEVIHETAATPWYTHGSHRDVTDAGSVSTLLSFEGARAMAVRVGDLAILQWLMEKIDLPIESTLLEEAVYADEREIILWLLENHPEACAPKSPLDVTSVRFSGDQLDWLEENQEVRDAVNFERLIVPLVRGHDTQALRCLHEWYPHLLHSVPELCTHATDSKVVAFLDEIDYAANK